MVKSMLDTWHNKEILHGISAAIYEHAAKVSDERMFWIGVVSAIASFSAVCVALIISNRQLKQQIDISFFKERTELYSFLQKLCYFGSQQKIILEKY